MTLDQITPKIVNGQQLVELAQEKVEKELQKWKLSLITYFISESPGYKMMQRYVMQFWTTVKQPEIYIHDEDYYIVRFHFMSDMQEIFYNGPYTINNKPIILKPWTPEFNLEKEFPTAIPLWVKFSNLPMSCWSKDSLSRITSAVDKPVYADECTANQIRISFARILIEVNITNPLPTEIIIMERNGKQTHQVIDYDWKLKYYTKCSVVGHCCLPKEQRPVKKDTKKQQYKIPIQEWKSKGPIKTNVGSTDQRQEG